MVQGERNAKEKRAFPFIPEPQPNLGGAKVVQGERRGKEKRAFPFISRAQHGGVSRCGTYLCPPAGAGRRLQKSPVRRLNDGGRGKLTEAATAGNLPGDGSICDNGLVGYGGAVEY